MKLGEVIGLIMKKKGFTQVEVARKIGKSTTALSQIIKGVYDPNPETLEKICEVLQVPKPVLFFLTISEEDIPKEKLELYNLLAPAIKDFLIKIFGDEENLFVK